MEVFRKVARSLIGANARVALSVAVVVCAGVLAACSDAAPEATSTSPSMAATATPPPTAASTPTAAPTPTATPAPSPTPAPTAQAPREILEAAVAATNALDSFRFDVEISFLLGTEGSGAEAPITLSGYYKAPGMVQGVMSLNLGPTAIEMEVIDTGEAMYIKDPEMGVWVKGEGADAFFSNPSDLIALEDMDLSEATSAGTENIDGVEHHVIEAVVSDLLGIGAGDLRYVFWVRSGDGLLGQIRVEGSLNLGEGLLGLGGDDAGLSLTMRLSDYNKDVTIEAPTSAQVSPPPAPRPFPPSTAEPIDDHTSLFLSIQAMEAAQSVHVEGELALKEGADAQTSLLLQRFSGDGVLNGANQISGTMEVNVANFAGTVEFETRRVGGVDYSLDPSTGRLVAAPPGEDQAILNSLFIPSVIGAFGLVDPVVTLETLDGAAVFRVDAGVEDSDLPITRKVLWIDGEDYLLRQVYLEGVQPASAFPGLESAGGEIHVSLTARYSRYDEPVDITAP